eukprot:Opistho-2@41443
MHRGSMAAPFLILPIEVLFVHIIPRLSTADVASLSHTNSFLRTQLRRMRTFTLHDNYAVHYFEDALFRSAVGKVIPKDRIVIDFYRTEVDLLCGLRSLSCVETTRAIDVSPLEGIHTLNLTASYVFDVSALGGVHTLILTNCPGVEDVSALGGVHSLDLRGCPRVVDVSTLGTVHTLD